MTTHTASQAIAPPPVGGDTIIRNRKGHGAHVGDERGIVTDRTTPYAITAQGFAESNESGAFVAMWVHAYTGRTETGEPIGHDVSKLANIHLTPAEAIYLGDLLKAAGRDALAAL